MKLRLTSLVVRMLDFLTLIVCVFFFNCSQKGNTIEDYKSHSYVISTFKNSALRAFGTGFILEFEKKYYLATTLQVLGVPLENTPGRINRIDFNNVNDTLEIQFERNDGQKSLYRQILMDRRDNLPLFFAYDIDTSTYLNLALIPIVRFPNDIKLKTFSVSKSHIEIDNVLEVNDEIAIVGYSKGNEQKMVKGKVVSSHILWTNIPILFFHDGSIEPGMVGSPVYYKNNGSHALIGIFSSGIQEKDGTIYYCSIYSKFLAEMILRRHRKIK